MTKQKRKHFALAVGRTPMLAANISSVQDLTSDQALRIATVLSNHQVSLRGVFRRQWRTLLTVVAVFLLSYFVFGGYGVLALAGLFIPFADQATQPHHAVNDELRSMGVGLAGRQKIVSTLKAIVGTHPDTNADFRLPPERIVELMISKK